MKRTRRLGRRLFRLPAGLSLTDGKYFGLGLLLSVTVAVPTLSGGGFDASSRSIFVVLAGAALLAAALTDGRTAVRGARSTLALTLVALALLSVASSEWTVASPASAVRWGLVIGGYAAVFIAAATLAHARNPWLIAAGVGVLAVTEAILGLRAVAFHELPDAERIVRTWRPGGSFEYPPALAILEVGALPVFSYALARARAPAAGGAAIAAMLAGGVLGLAGSRLALALTAVLLVALILRPPTYSRARTAAVATAALVVIGGLAAPLVLGEAVGAARPGARTAGAAEFIALSVAASVGWLLVRRMRGTSGRTLAAVGASVAIALAIVLAASVISGRVSDESPDAGAVRAARRSDFLHGRSHEWLAAIDTWLDRPWLGAGADSYRIASRPHQTVASSRFAHNLPLELAAELGALGLLLALALYASTTLTILKAVRSPQLWLLAPFVIAFLASNLVDWTWHLAGLGAGWAAASGALSQSETNRVRGDQDAAGVGSACAIHAQGGPVIGTAKPTS